MQSVRSSTQSPKSRSMAASDYADASTTFSPTSERSPLYDPLTPSAKLMTTDGSPGIGPLAVSVSSPLLPEESARARSGSQYTAGDVADRTVVYGLGERTWKHSTDTADRPGLADVSRWELAAITCFNVPYGLVCSTFAMLILPHECSKFSEKTSGEALSHAFLLVGLSQLVCPIAGRWSDGHSATNTLSKRQPYIILGCIIGVVSCCGLWYASHYVMMSLYFTSLFMSVVGLNIIYSVQSCLPSDLVAVELHGVASGYVALLALCGGQFGFMVLIITSMFNVVASTFIYPLVIATVITSCVVLLVIARRLQQRLTLRQMADAYQTCPSPTSRDGLTTTIATGGDPVALSVDFEFGMRSISACAETRANSSGVGAAVPTSGAISSEVPISDAEERTLRQRISKLRIWKDFAFVFFSRTFYYIAISCQAFMLFYTRDVLHTSEFAQQEIRVATMVFLSQGTAALVAVPCGTYSDNKGVSKKRLIYYSCIMMSAVYAWFIIAPILVPAPNTFYSLLPGSILYGAGSGCFLAIDYALALAATPTASQSGQALGLWGVSFFIGAAIGPVMWSRCLAAFSGPGSALGYTYSGYVVMLFGGMVSTLLSAGLVVFIRGVH